ncbi:MAG: hypothetical protein IPM42_03610 [Saprospiraceae bacterium]|nr:hypothetical protein [Saprospiraceae bacterium]
MAEPGKYFDFKHAVQNPSYTEWLNNDGHTSLNKFIFTNYLDFKLSGVNFENNLVFLNNRSSHGFSLKVKHSELMNYEILNFWQIFLANELLSSRYIIHLAEVKANATKGDEELSVTVYLKPSVRLPLENGKLSQLYGNVHMEIQKLAEEESQFKILVHHYNDRNYNPAYNLESLMVHLFQC